MYGSRRFEVADMLAASGDRLARSAATLQKSSSSQALQRSWNALYHMQPMQQQRRQRPRESATAAASEKLVDPFSFQAWAKGVATNGVEVKYFSDGLRGVAATKELKPDTTLISVPGKRAFEVVNSKRSLSTFPDFVPQEFWSNCQWDERLAFKLLYDLKIKKKESDRYTYLTSLPDSFSTPLNWSPESLRQSQYKALETRVVKQKNQWEKWYQAWQQTGAELAKKVQKEDYMWAMECVNSRTFSGVYEGSTSDDRLRLCLFTGGLAVLWPSAGWGTWENSLNAVLVVAFSIVLQSLITTSTAKLKRYVMCPVVDMFNHRSNSTAEATCNFINGNFELITGADESYAPGEQIYITYGRHGNDHLLQYYGFVEESNQFDSYDFDSSFPAVFQRLGDALKKEAAGAELPQEPSQEERLAKLKRLLQESSAAGLVLGKVGVGDNEGEVKASDDENAKAIDTNMRFFPSTGWDEQTQRCMRAMCASSSEWQGLCDASGQLGSLEALSSPLSADTERRSREALKAMAFCELESLPSTAQEDLEALEKMNAGADDVKFPGATDSWSPSSTEEAKLLLAFRVEKKVLLRYAADIY
eukprot:gnl/TRDRNA2_/TRDRNA2_158324_c1_seq1.p1 gnl/TRDRNA2_/TRDRNA2_158324_c1~~gnl/TRDRNA2_/TRDRNA2_158324_c1_seq1.p1  ORF type:complete len:651 (-),score=113.21 gnl/TRDRNA2_/TRDRNA2_158324_c1_seq1:24-1787(-)